LQNEIQILLIRSIKDRGSLTVSDAAGIIFASNDTVLREMHVLMNIGIVKKEGIGRKTRYFPQL
jgi:predicted transcriptional regulator